MLGYRLLTFKEICFLMFMKSYSSLLFVLFSILWTASLLNACAGSKKETELKTQIDTDYQMAVGYYENKQTPEAIRYLALVLANDPTHAEANHLMGFIRLGRGQYEEAVKHFKRALETKPDMLNCQNNLGAAYLHLEQYEEAAVLFKELTKSPLYTSPWLAFVNLGWAYYQMGMTQEAIDETETAISLNPDLCLGYNNLGIYYHSLGRDESAIKNLDEAVKLCAHYAEPHLHLGMILEAQGDTKRAIEHFNQCKNLTPKSDLGSRCAQNADILAKGM